MTQEMKLTLELIPSTKSLHSLHNYLTTKAWTTLRQKVLEQNGSRCAVCGVDNVRLDCNEQWEYNDETHIQVCCKCWNEAFKREVTFIKLERIMIKQEAKL